MASSQRGEVMRWHRWGRRAVFALLCLLAGVAVVASRGGLGARHIGGSGPGVCAPGDPGLLEGSIPANRDGTPGRRVP